MELTPLRNAIVGVPGVSGLSVEQRKRLTIGVELVANPSIVFMVCSCLLIPFFSGIMIFLVQNSEQVAGRKGAEVQCRLT